MLLWGVLQKGTVGLCESAGAVQKSERLNPSLSNLGRSVFAKGYDGTRGRGLV
jgi:hypothetical protein